MSHRDDRYHRARLRKQEAREKMIGALNAAAHCERWEFQEKRCEEFADALDEYLAAERRLRKVESL